jgi:chitinase
MRAANMLTGVTSLLSFSTLVQAAAIPQGTNYNMTTSSAVSGYKNVAYFVNWVCSLA